MQSNQSVRDYAKTGNNVKLEPNFGGYAISRVVGGLLEHFSTLALCEETLKDAGYAKTTVRNIYALKDSAKPGAASPETDHPADLYVYSGKTAADRKFVAIIRKQKSVEDSYRAEEPWVLLHNSGRVDRFEHQAEAREEAEKTYGVIRCSRAP